jgi:Holliday junction resolvasome RuvABC endonuclease subunit
MDTDTDTVIERRALRAHGGPDDERLASLVVPICAACTNAKAVGAVLCACELPVHGPNLRTIAGLARVAGVILAAATLVDLPCVSVQPAEAKQALTGRGNADKHQMLDAAWRQFGLTGKLTDAEADALGIALAGAAKWQEKCRLDLDKEKQPCSSTTTPSNTLA